MLDALPNRSSQKGRIASITFGETGVVAAWSM